MWSVQRSQALAATHAMSPKGLVKGLSVVVEVESSRKTRLWRPEAGGVLEEPSARGEDAGGCPRGGVPLVWLSAGRGVVCLPAGARVEALGLERLDLVSGSRCRPFPGDSSPGRICS